MPLLGLLFGHPRWWVVAAGVLVATAALRLFCYELLVENRSIAPIAYPMILQLPCRLDEFVFGMVGAWFHLRRTGPTPRRDAMGLAAGLLGVIALMGAVHGRGDFFGTADAPWIFGYATFARLAPGLVVYAAASPLPFAQILFGERVLGFLGTISYSLHLWHSIVFQVAYRSGFTQWLPVSGVTALGLALMPVALVIAWISYRVTAHPFLVTAPAAHNSA